MKANEQEILRVREEHQSQVSSLKLSHEEENSVLESKLVEKINQKEKALAEKE